MVSIERNYYAPYASGDNRDYINFRNVRVFREDLYTSHYFVLYRDYDYYNLGDTSYPKFISYLKYYTIVSGTVTYSSNISFDSPADIYDIVFDSGTGYYYVSTAGRILCGTVTAGTFSWVNTSCYVNGGNYFKNMHYDSTNARVQAVVYTGSDMQIWTFSQSGSTLVRTGTVSLGGVGIVVTHMESANSTGQYFLMSYTNLGTAVYVTTVLSTTTGITFVSGSAITLSYATDNYVNQFATNLHEGSPATRLYFGHGGTFYIYSLNSSYVPTLLATHSLNVSKVVKLANHLALTLTTGNQLVVYKLIGDGGLRNDALNSDEYISFIMEYNVTYIASARYSDQIVILIHTDETPPMTEDEDTMRVLDVTRLVGHDATFIQ